MKQLFLAVCSDKYKGMKNTVLMKKKTAVVIDPKVIEVPEPLTKAAQQSEPIEET